MVMENIMIMNLNKVSNKKNNGFTLIELSIVILIVGILVIPILEIYNSYLLRKQMIVTRENVQNTVDGLSLVLNRYPCPSDRSLPVGDPNFAIEQCNLAFPTDPICINFYDYNQVYC
jgi:prepilin-type N-terminal cleavage/methylation domain-containing protein